nr:hypothetical protein BaRGS_012541 [Batillaria attramentaria]
MNGATYEKETFFARSGTRTPDLSHWLFETHPDVQEIFLPFKGQSLDDLKHSTQLKSHVLRVMGTVEKCLARINEPDKLEALLHDLGAKHLLYNARIDYIDS